MGLPVKSRGVDCALRGALDAPNNIRPRDPLALDVKTNRRLGDADRFRKSSSAYFVLIQIFLDFMAHDLTINKSLTFRSSNFNKKVR